MNSRISELADLANFTDYEKKVYTALFDLGSANVKELAHESSVPKPKVYSVLDSLHNHGFISLEGEKPKTYSALPPSNAFEKVIEKRKEEIEEMEDLIEDVKSEETQESNNRFLKVIKDRDTVLGFLAEELNEAEEEYVTVGRFVSSYTPLQSVMSDKEDIEMFFVGPEEHSKDYVVEKYRNIGLKVKTVEMEEIPFRFSIYDNEKLALTLTDEKEGYTTIWTNYPSLVKNMRDFFSFYWEQR